MGGFKTVIFFPKNFGERGGKPGEKTAKKRIEMEFGT
jgi:hypothetical protein